MKLHIDCLEEKLNEMEYCKEENGKLREKIKDLFLLKSENLSLISQVKQGEESLFKIKMKLSELEEKAKCVTVPVSVISHLILYRSPSLSMS